MANIYDFVVKSNKGEKVCLKEYKGKVLVIVNTATGCGFTPQYKGLEDLYQKYQKKGLVILDFPCDQFGIRLQGQIMKLMNFVLCDTKLLSRGLPK